MKTAHILTHLAILPLFWICSCSSDPEIVRPEEPPTPFINQQDMEALRAIYKEGGGEYWDTPWDLNDSTKWAGIKCNLVNPETNEYRVTWLHLVCNRNFPVGILSEEVGKLTHLQVLLLDGNGFGGELPKSLANLKNLIELNVIGTNISGEIPEGIVSLPQLGFLSMNQNKLSGELPKDITNTSPTVVYITLRNNNLSGKIPKNLKVRYLDLEHNNFTEYPYEYIPASREIEHEGPAVLMRYNKINGLIPDSILNSPYALTNVRLFINPQQKGYGPSNYPKE